MARFAREERDEDVRLGSYEQGICKRVSKSDLPDKSSEFIIDAIVEIEDLKETDSTEVIAIMKSVAKSYGFRFLGEGTSRVVFMDDEENVLKIAHRKLGFTDNKYEWNITEMVDQGYIQKDASRRLALCHSDVDSGTDFVIAQRYYEALGKENDTKSGYNGIKYILKNYDEYKEMIADLETEFFLCDIHPKRAFNIGLGKSDRMVVIDYGLFIPKSIIDDVTLDNGVTFKKGEFYCKCGKKLKYNIPKVDGHIDDAISEITEKGSKKSSEYYICLDCGQAYDTREMHEQILNELE